MKRLFVISALAFLSTAQAATEINTTAVANSPSVVTGEDENRVQLQIAPEVASILKSTDHDKAAGAGVSFIYALSDSVGMGGGIRHAISPNMNGAVETKKVYTQFDIRLVYALNKGLIYYTSKKPNEQKVGGTRVQFYVNQYYFSREVTPYSGPGIGVSQEFMATKALNYIVGTRFDRISNSSQTLYPLQAYAGIGLRL